MLLPEQKSTFSLTLLYTDTHCSKVNQINEALQQIEGGAIRGNNLFHSFSEFNINEGNSAFFVNPSGIINILSRVTGNNISQISGELGVLGEANLFFINPNGIFFGPNATLNINGSFIASTASSIILGNGGPLTINATESVEVSGTGTVGEGIPVESSLISEAQGIGGNAGELIINTPQLTVSNQAIVTASTSGQNANANNILINNANSVLIDNGSLTTAVNQGAQGEGGDITINTDNLFLENGGIVRSSTSGEGNAGKINLAIAERLNLQGKGTALEAQTLTSGRAGDITIRAPEINILDSATISAFTQGEGDGGNINIDSPKNIILRKDSNLTVETSDRGKAGNINITSPMITIGENAQLSATATESSRAPMKLIKLASPYQLYH